MTKRNLPHQLLPTLILLPILSNLDANLAVTLTVALCYSSHQPILIPTLTLTLTLTPTATLPVADWRVGLHDSAGRLLL